MHFFHPSLMFYMAVLFWLRCLRYFMLLMLCCLNKLMLCRRIKCQNVFIGEVGAHVHIFSAFCFDIQVSKDTSQSNCACKKV